MIPLKICAVAENVSEKLSKTETLSCAALGFAVVFAVLLVLMAFIAVISRVMHGAEPARPPEAAVSAPPDRPREEQPAPAAERSEALMYVTLGGKRHRVTVGEKLPRFTVSLNGKRHAVDVEEIDEGAEK